MSNKFWYFQSFVGSVSHLVACWWQHFPKLPRVSSTIVFEQLQDQFSHRDSDWPRFLYDSLSLCEHIPTTTVITLTVIMCSIFSLDSTDGQSEISPRWSAATESRWSSWSPIDCCINQEFRSFPRFLYIPAKKWLFVQFEWAALRFESLSPAQ